MIRRLLPSFVLSLALLAGTAQARPIAIGGVTQAAAVQTFTANETEMLPVWALPRLGVEVRNDPQDLRLRFGGRELRYSPALGWRSLGLRLSGPLATPQSVSGSLYAPLEALRRLGVPVQSDSPQLLAFAAPTSLPVATLPPSEDAPATEVAPTPLPQFAQNLQVIRVNTELHRTVETRRLVLELSGTAAPRFTVQASTAGNLTIRLTGIGAAPTTQTLSSGQTLTVTPDAGGTSVKLSGVLGRTQAFTLSDPPRVVLDTVRQTDPAVPPPLNPEELPEGVTYRQLGGLHLLSFDPQRFEPRIVSAPQGPSTVDQLVQSVGGVAGVNASYFALASGLPVDLVVRGGLMLSPSLEKRGTVGFLPSGGLVFGYPRPRYRVGSGANIIYVNSVTPNARPDWLTAFVGDGKTSVGREGLVTLYTALGGGRVQQVFTRPNVPPAGTIALTFDPQKFPTLPRQQGARLDTALDWRTPDPVWQGVTAALSAGPLLVGGGRPVTDPQREGFDTAASIWRPTRQVALGVLRGQPTIAYLEYGTPEAFASALASAGLSDALRLDSGSSATVYAGAGYGDFGGYLNTVWSRPVPNAVVFVAKRP